MASHFSMLYSWDSQKEEANACKRRVPVEDLGHFLLREPTLLKLDAFAIDLAQHVFLASDEAVLKGIVNLRMQGF